MTPIARDSGTKSPLIRRDELRDRITEAARKCFRENGVRNTTMDVIAAAAGTSRRDLYRSFASRDELVEAAIVASMREGARGLPNGLGDHDSFAEALVELTVAIVEHGRADQEQRALYDALDHSRLHEMLSGPYPPVAQIVLDTWRPWLTAARITGEIRPDVTDESIVEWLRGIFLMLILRNDLTAEQERHLVRTFVVPSLLAGRTPTHRKAR